MPSEVEARLERILGDYLSLERRLERMERYDSPIYVPWTDYSATSTVAGFASFTDKEIYYKRVGSIVYVVVYISGTSNDTAAQLTLPYAAASAPTATQGYARVRDNGTWQAAGLFYLPASSSTCSFYINSAGGVFVNSGTKSLMCEFWYHTTQAV